MTQPEAISVGQLGIDYLVDGSASGGMGMFELTVPPIDFSPNDDRPNPVRPEPVERLRLTPYCDREIRYERGWKPQIA